MLANYKLRDSLAIYRTCHLVNSETFPTSAEQIGTTRNKILPSRTTSHFCSIEEYRMTEPKVDIKSEKTYLLKMGHF